MARTPESFLESTLVIVPALNERDCVGSTVQRWLAMNVGGVRVVDNGSTDDTATVAREAGAEVLSEPRRGYGAAAWRGLQNCPPAIQWVLFSSADGSDRLSAEEVPAWERAVAEGADLVIGDRVSFPESRAQLKATQRAGNWISCQAIGLGWGQSFRDMGSLRLARAERLRGLGLRDRAFGWNVEMQVRALEQGWKLVELPVQFHPRAAGESKISGNLLGTLRAGRGICQMLLFLLALRLTRTRRMALLPELATTGPARNA